MSKSIVLGRRSLIGAAAVCGLVPGPLALAPLAMADERPQGKGTKAEAEAPVTPTEDLMREHGVLRRILLIYEAGARRLGQGEDMESIVFVQTAETMRDFIHNYHEKLEEDHLFPIFKKAGRMVQLVDVLLTQHAAGRKLTDRILQLAPTAPNNSDQRKAMIEAMQASIVLYRPHAAREDTDLFPTLRHLVTPNQFDALGETFEQEENAKFGGDGFEKAAKKIEQIEKKIGINDLSQYTPKI
ncbi:Hemerythrin-like domain-containing protein [Enhydrobacter aerosaccus]|uniref:Hemerythrin-like domain-containing protein n=1 Tax=Enhydrobacter aerosaccus TaxID=225324 RepID=A0A1T4RQQ7_9HYPH|nr:hemerythrin domain-containing protein [Enhydrobacter aerosaccus]SKA18156.1 Hemerythrin-like domain-containing protein [Enhydrobacter aerosaccus]